MKTEVLLPKVFNFSFTYNSGNIPLKLGDFVEIPFGQRKEIGVVWKSKKIDLKKNIKIKNISKIISNSNNLCFHAGTILSDNQVLSVGGRVLNFVSLSDNFLQARNEVIQNIKNLDWKDGFYRKDIGFKVINQ